MLAPTYVASGVGGKHTVEFSAVNLQVVDGTGATASVNGTGNLVIGYAENSSNRARTGSHNLIVGAQNGWTSFSDLVTGGDNQASGPNSAVFGEDNAATGQFTLDAGYGSTTSGSYSSILGGVRNVTSGAHAAILGGEYNQANSVERRDRRRLRQPRRHRRLAQSDHLHEPGQRGRGINRRRREQPGQRRRERRRWR